MILSVCMIVKNEERHLAACLGSVRAIADEIVIVDTGSTDRTVEIARQFGAKILHHAWENDFSKARNIGLNAASGMWILQIDADERLENPRELLKVLKENQFSNTGGFFVDVFSTARRADGGADNYRTQLLRVFKNHPAIRFSGAIHEQISDAISRAGFEIQPTNIAINHLGYDISPEETRQKNLRNLELLKTELLKKPQDAYLLLQLAKTYLALGNLAEAENTISEALHFAETHSTIRPQILNLGGVIAFQNRQPDVAVSRARESVSLIENQSFAHFILGEAYWSQQNFQQSLAAFLKMGSAQNNPDLRAAIAGEYNLPPEQLAFKTGRCYVALQDWKSAEISFKKGLEANSQSADCLIGLANVSARTGNIPQAKNLLLKALEIAPERQDIHGFLKTITDFERTQPAISPMNTSFKKPLLSLSMIVKNEEENLAGCLESVRGIADEIVIVDTGSTDRTLEIARQFGAKIRHFSWIGDFAAARNESLKHCTGEWILYLDADERFQISQPDHFKNLLKTVPPEIGAFICTIVSPHRQLDDSTEVHQGGYPRLFKNYGYPRVHFKGRVHEQITPSLLECGAKIVASDIKILHLGYDQSQDVMKGKVQRNYELLIQHVQEEPQNAYAWFQLGQTLARMELLKEAQSALELSIELGTLSPSIAASAASSLAHIAGNAKQYADALKWAEFSLLKAPDQVLALNYKAHALLFLKRGREAEEAFLEVLQRMKNKGNSQAGFEVELPEAVVLQGLQRARALI
jgi:glycosyltransferase involved in cell wall biosynthesis